MNVLGLRKGIARLAAAAVAVLALNGGAMASYDFNKAWKDVAAAQGKGLPRTVTNKVSEIVREAVAEKRWPTAARAFLVREDAMREFRDELPQDWLPGFAASVDAQPAPLQAVLQLHLAHTYLENSRSWRWGGESPTKLDDEAAADKMPPWSPEKIGATLEAQIKKVFAHADELKRQKLDDWAELFDRGNMPVSYMPTLYDFAVRDAIRFYDTSAFDDTLERGLALYDDLIAFHQADGGVDALAYAELERAEHVKTFDRKPGKERDAAFEAFLDDFLKRYGDRTEVVAIAAAKKARMLEDRDESVAAHALAAEYKTKWTETPGGKMCAALIGEIEDKSLSVDVERNWCAPWPEVKVTVQNVSEVYFRLVPVSHSDLVNDTSMGSSVSSYGAGASAVKNDYIKRRPAKEWRVTLPLKPDYSMQVFSLAVPDADELMNGHYILYVATNEKYGADELPLYAQHVTITPLALVMNAGNGTFAGSVYRAESGEPVAGARVELWGYDPKGGSRQRLCEIYMTDADGRFEAKVPNSDKYNALSRHVRVVKDGCEVLSLDSEGSGAANDEKKTLEHVEIFTDRALYRPGQEIKVKGIAYHADPHRRDFHTLTDAFMLVMFKDPNGKAVSTKRMRTNKWGSFTCAFDAPTDRLTGGYSVVARVILKGGITGEGNARVNVEEYKRPKFSVSFEGAPEKATLGEPVTVTGTALTYSGLPVQNAKVDWQAERKTRYPSWWSWFGLDYDSGDGFLERGEAKTDENGVFKVTFTPEASPTADLSGDPSFYFTVSAVVTDETGEARNASESFEIGTVAWRASIHAQHGEWQTADKPVEVDVYLKSLAGSPLPVAGTLKAFRLKSPERPVRKPAEAESYRGNRNAKGPWDWETWEVGDEVATIDIEVRDDEAKKWTTELKLGVGAYRLAFEAKDPNGKSVKAYANVFVFDPSAKSFGVAVPETFRVEKSTVKVGETLRAYWSTGYETGWCRVKVTNNGRTVLEKTIGGESPVWNFELPVKDEHRGEFRIETLFVRENRAYHNSTSVDVPWDNKYLDIKAEHMTSRLRPGGKETWKFKVSGPAEVLAFMYDRSLDAYRWHNVSLNFSSRFTPWTRWLPAPTLENRVNSLCRMSGSFPDGYSYDGLENPTWRSFDVRYGILRMMKMSSGFGSGMVCDEVAGAAPEVECEREIACCADRSSAQGRSASEPDKPPRTNLKETAFFFPELETAADGSVAFTFTAPDALTGWKLLMVAHDNELRGGVLRDDEITTTKPLMCEPNAPRFVREGDDFLFAVKVTNTEDDSRQNGVVSLAVEEMEGDRKFDIAPQSFELKPHESKTFEFRLPIPDGCGYLRYVARAKGAAFSDGEEGVLPVLSRRVLVREAMQLNVRGNATKSFRFENLVASKGSDTIRHQDLTVRAVSRPAWYAVLSMPYLMEFPHECCEQTFSRYYANALGQHIASSDPRIRATFDAWKAAGAQALKSPLEADPHLKAIAIESTPWVREAEHEGAARARLGELFAAERLSGEQAACLEKLRLAQCGDGLWPWFPGGPSSDGITLYILTGFARLNSLAGLKCPDFFKSAVVALDDSVAKDIKKRLQLEKTEKIPFRADGFDARWLYLHSFKCVPAAKNWKDAKLVVDHLAKEWTDLDLESQALAAIALKWCGEDRLAKEIMASIKERGIVSEELGMYWKRPCFFSCSVFAAPVSTQALIAEAFRKVTGDEASAEACNVWLLKQRQTQDWTTTAATADAIYALMLGGGSDLLAGDKLAEVTLGGKKVPACNAEAGTGMYSHRYAASEIEPEMGEITFTGAGEKGVAWGGVHWSYFEDVLKVRAHEPKELRIEKKYYKKVHGPKGARLTSIDGVLEPGDELVARLEITSDRTYEFVHLSDERPACAEPVDVLSSYRWRDGVGYYQSTRDTATHYYIDRLNKGVFVLETSYRVQQRGRFTGGLATIQCMYAPEFTAHSTAEGVSVDAR